jgi:hypothetical protein
MITQQRLQELFSYQDGNLVRKITVAGNAKAGSIAGSYHNKGYVQVYVDGKNYLLHRLIYLYHKGYMPNLLDHINNNKQDNSIENLREATYSQNQQNKKVQCTNKLQLKGAVYHPGKNKWQGRIQLNKKKISLGYFNTAEQAHEAYKIAAVKYFNEFARFK